MKCTECGNKMKATTVAHHYTECGLDKEGQLRGPEIRFMRKKVGMNGKSFAEFIGVSPVTMSRWETGEIKPSPSHDNLIRFAFRQMMCERLRTIVTWMEERIKKAHIVTMLRNRFEVDAKQLARFALPEMAGQERHRPDQRL